MKYFILFYEVVPDYVERRAQYRAEHLALAKAATERGDLRLGGAYADPAVVVPAEDQRGAARRFVEADPYVRNGLVAAWRIRAWTVVVGADHDGPLP